ncbi:MAG: TRCF domain-containing protein, partial [Cetobacterium sp.]
YIEGDERLIIYRRLVDTRDLEKLSEIKVELIDRFGELPKEVVSLLRYLEIKILAKDLKIEEIVEKDGEYFLKFNNDYVNFEKLMKLIEEKKARYSQKENGLYYFEDILKFLYWYKGDDGYNEKV